MQSPRRRFELEGPDQIAGLPPPKALRLSRLKLPGP